MRPGTGRKTKCDDASEGYLVIPPLSGDTPIKTALSGRRFASFTAS